MVVEPRAPSHGGDSLLAGTDAPLDACAAPFLLHQDSSGGDNWRSTNHINRERQIARAFRGYRLTQRRRDSSRGFAPRRSSSRATATPRCRSRWSTSGRISRRRLRPTGAVIELHLFPPQDLDLHEIQGGEQKTHTFHLAPRSGHDLGSRRSNGCGARHSSMSIRPMPRPRRRPLPHCPTRDAPHRDRLALIRAAIEGADTFEAKREVIDEYGWRHFGDVYGDHEAVRHTGPRRSSRTTTISTIRSKGSRFSSCRARDRRWWHAMRELAWHVADIDIYHTDRDKAAYNRGLFWHTVHYVDADTATHRTYPSTFGHGGGPANEQNYVSGLTLAWLLTGEAAFREAAIDLAEFPIRIDDGSRHGLSLAGARRHGPRDSVRHIRSITDPGRGSGNSLSALIDGYQLTGERQLSREGRADHPARRSTRATTSPHATCSMPSASGSTRCSSRRWADTSISRSERGEHDRDVRMGAGQPAALRTLDGRPRISVSGQAGDPRVPDRDVGGAGHPQERCLPLRGAARGDERGARAFSRACRVLLPVLRSTRCARRRRGRSPARSSCS